MHKTYGYAEDLFGHTILSKEWQYLTGRMKLLTAHALVMERHERQICMASPYQIWN